VVSLRFWKTLFIVGHCSAQVIVHHKKFSFRSHFSSRYIVHRIGIKVHHKKNILNWLCFLSIRAHWKLFTIVLCLFVLIGKTSVNMSKGALIHPFSQDEIKNVRYFLKKLDKTTCKS